MPFCPACGSDKVDITSKTCPDCGYVLGSSPDQAATTPVYQEPGATTPVYQDPGVTTPVYHDQAGMGAPIYSPPPKSSKKLFVILGVAAVLLVILVGAVFFFLSGRSEAVKFAPKDSMMVMYVKPDLLQLYRAGSLRDTYMADPDFKKLYDDFIAKLSVKKKITFEKDIEPWLGGEFAVIMPAMDSAKGSGGLGSPSAIGSPIGAPPEPIIAIATDDEELTTKFIEDVTGDKMEKGDKFKDVQVYTISGEYYAYLNGFLLISNQSGIETAISTYKGDSNVTDNKAYDELIAQLPSSRTATLYFDLGPLAEEIQKNMAYSPELQAMNMEDMGLGALKGVAAGMYIDSEGINIDFVQKMDDSKLTDKQRDMLNGSEFKLDKYIGYVQQDTLGFFGVSMPKASSDMLYELVYRGLDSVEKEAGSSQSPVKISEVRAYVEASQKAYGSDWLLTVNPDESFWGYTEAPVSVSLVRSIASESDYKECQDQLRKIAEGTKALKVVTADVGGLETTQYKLVQTVPDLDFILLSGVDKGTELITTSEASMEKSLSGKGLSANTQFKEARGHMPEPMAGIFYIDIKAVMSLVGDIVEKQGGTSAADEYNKQVAPLFRPLKSMCMGSGVYDSKTGITTSTIFIGVEYK